ncbi:MAG: transposase [Methylococcaceae bacterium]|nr:transposase [Methylococcaceae bacterium]
MAVTCIGGEHRGGKRGRGSPNKTPFAVAVSVNEKERPIAININVVNGFSSKEIAKWAVRHLDADRLVVSDGLTCFAAVSDAGCQHIGIVTNGGPGSVSLETTWVNTIISHVNKVY